MSLYIISTPIGNLDDISIRALDTLRKVDIIACEDKRYSLRLLNKYNIVKKLIEINVHNEDKISLKILSILKQGKEIALISNAGTPLVSDPGGILLRLIHESDNGKVKVYSIPGACALIAAGSISGLINNGFIFHGFMPSRSATRRKLLNRIISISAIKTTNIIYESTHRIKQSLIDMSGILGENLKVFLARELTKVHEQVIYKSIKELLDKDYIIKGELVLIFQYQKKQDHEIEDLINGIFNKPPREIAKVIAEYSGISKNVIYDMIIKAKNNEIIK